MDPDSGSCSISILDYIMDRNMANLTYVLVGNFIGSHPNIEVVRDWVT